MLCIKLILEDGRRNLKHCTLAEVIGRKESLARCKRLHGCRALIIVQPTFAFKTIVASFGCRNPNVRLIRGTTARKSLNLNSASAHAVASDLYRLDVDLLGRDWCKGANCRCKVLSNIRCLIADDVGRFDTETYCGAVRTPPFLPFPAISARICAYLLVDFLSRRQIADIGVVHELYAMRRGGLPRIHDRLAINVAHDGRETAYVVGKGLMETYG